MALFSAQETPTPPFTVTENIEYSWRWDAKRHAFILQVPQGEIIYLNNFLTVR